MHPKGTKPKDYLAYHGKVFDCVEVDSSFYRIPNIYMTSRWAKVTPDHFRFTAKIPKSDTHDKRLGRGIESAMEYFYKSIQPLKEKTPALLLQLPPSMSMKEGLKKIEELPIEKGYRYAVEVRHKTWFTQELYHAFEKIDICLVWDQLDEIQAPSVLTTESFGRMSIPQFLSLSIRNALWLVR